MRLLTTRLDTITHKTQYAASYDLNYLDYSGSKYYELLKVISPELPDNLIACWFASNWCLKDRRLIIEVN